MGFVNWLQDLDLNDTQPPGSRQSKHITRQMPGMNQRTVECTHHNHTAIKPVKRQQRVMKFPPHGHRHYRSKLQRTPAHQRLLLRPVTGLSQADTSPVLHAHLTSQVPHAYNIRPSQQAAISASSSRPTITQPLTPHPHRCHPRRHCAAVGTHRLLRPDPLPHQHPPPTPHYSHAPSHLRHPLPHPPQ